jgi:phage terminase large subunit-like protein
MTVNGYEGSGSPDRVDAMVWLWTELFPDMVEPRVDASKYVIPRNNSGWLGA